MISKTNARPTVGAVERAETGNAVTGNIPFNDFNTPKPQQQESVFSLLPQGEGNAIHAKELAQLCGFRSTRELQHAIAIEREAGALILSTCRGGGGYYRPSDGETGKQEICKFVATLASRAINTLRALKAARYELKTVDGQITFDQIEAALMAAVNARDDGDG